MVDLLQPIRRIAGVTFVLTILFFSAFCPFGNAAAAPAGALDGRLGGSYASFISTYGEPVDLNPSIGEIFAVEGYGLVAAQFSRLASASNDDAPALLITLRSEREETVPATSLDDADWTVDEITDRAAAFAPADATFSEFTESEDGSLTATCASEALTESFGQISDGGCSIRAVQSAPGRISFVTLSLASSIAADPEGTPIPDCDGASDWAQKSGERMASAADLLGQLAAIDSAAPSAGKDLSALQSSFSKLATEQRSAETPAAATTANFYLISAFSGFASAIERAADGVANGDEAAVESAVQGINDANAKIERASAEIEKLVEDCGLAIASPVAAP